MQLKAVSLIDKAINELRWIYKESYCNALSICSCLKRDIAIHQRDVSQWLLQELKIMKKGIISAYNNYGVVTSPKEVEIWLTNNFPLINFDYSKEYLTRIFSNH